MVTEISFNHETIARHRVFGYITDFIDPENDKYLPCFPKKVLFKPGVNVLVGANGSGKSTIIKALQMYTFTEKSFYSRIPEYIHLYKILSPGIDVYGDYTRVAFNFREASALTGDDFLDGMENFFQSMMVSRQSSGQAIMITFQKMIDYMFGESKLSSKQLVFPIAEIQTKIEKHHGENNSYNQLLNYIKQHSVDCPSIFTLLLDEPDKGLDIFNIANTFIIYSKNRPDTQIIVCLHNPAVIYRLATQDNPPNFIELTPGYVGDVIEFIEGSISANHQYYKRGKDYA